MRPGDLPSARGNTAEEARAGLERGMHDFLQRKFAENQKEMDAYMATTRHGANLKKTKKLGAEIKERLKNTPEATPAPAAPGSSPETGPSSATSPMPEAAATALSPSPKG
ncbi:MAG: hypothetical protein ACR2NX_07975 [Chthoniobacterales bacterium]